MAAAQTVPQHLQHCNLVPIFPRLGVITLFGYGIKVNVDRGHLTVQDGIGGDRRAARLPRVGHGLRRLVVVGSDGMVSLAALRWLADQDAAFIMLDRDGSVLVSTGPVRPSDARLRRAQSLAQDSGVALKIAIELIRQKLIGQERLARDRFQDDNSATTIAKCRQALMKAKSSEEIRRYEAQGRWHIGLHGTRYVSNTHGSILNSCPNIGVPSVAVCRHLPGPLGSLSIQQMLS